QDQADWKTDWMERVASLGREDLHPAEKALQESYLTQKAALRMRKGETLQQAVRRITELVEKALEDNAAAFWWTGLRSERAVEDFPDAQDSPLTVGRSSRANPERPAESAARVVLPREPVSSGRADAMRRYGWHYLAIGPTPPE